MEIILDQFKNYWMGEFLIKQRKGVKMNEKLAIIIKDYIETVSSLCDNLLFEFGFNCKRELMIYLYYSGQRINELDCKGVHYFFHGRGCLAEYDNKRINWDFGYRGRWCGIDPWFVAEFLKYNKYELCEHYDGNRIKKECVAAVESNEMFEKYGQYYLIIPRNQTFKPNFPDEFDSLIIEHFDSKWEIPKNKVINRFIRKVTWVFNEIDKNPDKYNLRFISKGKEIYQIFYDDVGYPENAIKIMSDDIIRNLEKTL